MPYDALGIMLQFDALEEMPETTLKRYGIARRRDDSAEHVFTSYSFSPPGHPDIVYELSRRDTI